MRLALILGLFTASAFGQWISFQAPPNGVCFFTRSSFRGERFCVSANERMERVPSTFRRRISSLRLYGNAELEVFDTEGLTGKSLAIPTHIRDLHSPQEIGLESKYWNDRIASFRVIDNPNHVRVPGSGRFASRPKVGACFFREPGFRGDFFCLEFGRHEVPKHFRHDIESITVQGDVHVTGWDHDDFTGARIQVWSNTRDLHEFIREDERHRNWANRIASVEIRPRDNSKGEEK